MTTKTRISHLLRMHFNRQASKDNSFKPREDSSLINKWPLVLLILHSHNFSSKVLLSSLHSSKRRKSNLCKAKLQATSIRLHKLFSFNSNNSLVTFNSRILLILNKGLRTQHSIKIKIRCRTTLCRLRLPSIHKLELSTL